MYSYKSPFFCPPRGTQPASGRCGGGGICRAAPVGSRCLSQPPVPFLKGKDHARSPRACTSTPQWQPYGCFYAACRPRIGTHRPSLGTSGRGHCTMHPYLRVPKVGLSPTNGGWGAREARRRQSLNLAQARKVENCPSISSTTRSASSPRSYRYAMAFYTRKRPLGIRCTMAAHSLCSRPLLRCSCRCSTHIAHTESRHASSKFCRKVTF